MKKLWGQLRGKKTYIIGICLIIAGVLKDFDTEMIMQGLAFMALRAGIK